MLTVDITAVIRYVLKVLPLLLLLLLSSSTDDIRFRLGNSFVAPGKTKLLLICAGIFVAVRGFGSSPFVSFNVADMLLSFSILFGMRYSLVGM